MRDNGMQAGEGHMAAGFPFPFAVWPDGAIVPDGDPDLDLRGKIIQVLFTTPGERVNLPEFGCGLFNLVFDPNNAVLGAAMEFTIGAALTRWLGDLLLVDAVNVAAIDEAVIVEVAYIDRRNLSRQAVSVRFK
jgi:phage baseplate assembly protein W